MNSSDPYQHLQAVAEVAIPDVDASQLHGLLAGYLCGGGKAVAEGLLPGLSLEAEDAQAAGHLVEHLEVMRKQCRRQLAELNMGLQPLLPDEARPLSERVEGLLDWTRGFLAGFGLAGVDETRLSAEGREVLRDMATIAASDPDLEAETGQAGDGDESAWMELVEFVRVGGMLLHAEITAPEPGVHAGHA